MEKTEENLVKKTCKELGITQKELAEITKIDRGSLSRWNLNKRKIPEYIEQYLILLSRLNSYEKVINWHIQFLSVLFDRKYSLQSKQKSLKWLLNLRI